MASPSVSIVVVNYNYGPFVGHAIQSALEQEHRPSAVIVVDDGSTDESGRVIARFGQNIKTIFKENGGQASAFNAGLTASGGDVVIFLDADDWLLPDATRQVIARFQESPVTKVHWPLWEVNQDGLRSGNQYPRSELLQGDLLAETIRYGVPHGWGHPPTSGNAWSRPFLESVYPVRECGDKHGADGYLCALAPIFGEIARIDEPLGCYRRHESSFASGRDTRYRLRRDARRYPFYFRWIEFYLAKQGIQADTNAWYAEGSPYAWNEAALSLEKEIDALHLDGRPFILVDDGRLGPGYVPGARPMMERGGQYWGAPADDQEAIGELERQRRAGAACIVFSAGSLWWLEHYRRFSEYLRETYRCICRNGRLVAFDLVCERAK